MKTLCRFRQCCCPSFRCRRLRFWSWACRFATGLPCRARYAVSALRAGIPHVSVRFADCAVPLPGGSLRSPPPASPSPSCNASASGFFRDRHRRSLSPRLPLPAAPALGCASARRRSHSRTPSCSLPRRSPPAHAPRRLTPVPIPEPFSPTFGTLDWVFSTPFGGSALTPHASAMPSRQVCAGVRPDHRKHPLLDIRRPGFVGLSVYGFHIQVMPLIYMEKCVRVFSRESS